jgi:lysophospholipase L1-like esterase
MDKENYNITLLGDSISKGVIFDDIRGRYIIIEDSFCNLVQNKLKAAVHNAGRFGSTILRGSKKLYEEMTKSKPDIVLIEFGGNDCDFKWEDVALNPLVPHEPNTNLSVFRETLNKIVSNLRASNVTPVLMTLPPLDPERYFKWISQKRDDYAENILKWLGSVDRIYSWHACYNSVIIEIAKETNTNLIDVRSAFLNSDDYKTYLCIDGIHPNEIGHKLIAEKVIDFIKSNFNYLLKE